MTTDFSVNHSTLVWRKSSYSTANGNCVEVAVDGGAVFVRDSKAPADVIRFDLGVWVEFVRCVQYGQFQQFEHA